MSEKKSKYSSISKIGPMFKIEGGIIFLHPFKSKPLKGFNSENSFKNSELFLNSISERANKWFEKFPECCDNHKQLSEMEGFDKKKFDFIPNQILNNVKYFGYALETFIDKEEGINEIKDYLDYLKQSFGNPNIGGHLFENNVKHFIENGSLTDKSFTDDQRIELLQHFEPVKPPIDLEERDIESLYTIFQNWIDAIPNIGQFKELKSRFKGKVPMNIFAVEPKTNKYLGTTLFKTRSKTELLKFLINLTNDILTISRNEVKKENYNKNEIIIIAEERLRIKQNILLNKSTNELESNYLDLIENWLSMVIEFYQVINQVIQESNNESISSNINNAIIKIDEIKIELSSFCNSENVLNWLSNPYPKNSMDRLINDFENLNPNDEIMVLDAMSKLIKSKENPDINLEKIEEKINDPDISIKHKIKISIPIFLFTKYENELELSAKQKMPKSFKELKELFSK
ncbi:hypothetical protein [Tenacibaculum finnmarkense]|uniref:hypothetical protein n=1 Tax=Tenacibaculum finnmarkense TaxID=2781243 RepID=UPI002301E324|nr:hypothetical protein [Tenacibaculum finnmarkense]WCC46260.1 hypothetical protein PJH08_07590 [Tenacibaculum finnmarkense]